MIKDIIFRTLRANEIECRPQGMGKDNLDKEKLLLYMDSRVVVNLLNETVGNLGWQMELGTAGGQMVGRLGIIHPETGEWVWKSDTGSESNIEAEKGQVSDIYKRCLARWGVTELYSTPFILFPIGTIKEEGLKVSEIEYNEKREITHLRIVNRYGKQVFVWNKGTNATPSTPTESKKEEKTVDSNIKALNDFCNKLWFEHTGETDWEQEITDFHDTFLDILEGKKLMKGKVFSGKFLPDKMWEKWYNNPKCKLKRA